jgi:hypothetical protein
LNEKKKTTERAFHISLGAATAAATKKMHIIKIKLASSENMLFLRVQFMLAYLFSYIFLCVFFQSLT